MIPKFPHVLGRLMSLSTGARMLKLLGFLETGYYGISAVVCYTLGISSSLYIWMHISGEQ